MSLGGKSNWQKDAIVKSADRKVQAILITLVATFYVLLGWTIAVGCILMGAPFWFGLLLKLVNLCLNEIMPDSDAAKKN